MRTFLSIAFFLCVAYNGMTQNKIVIKDKHTGESIPFAHVMYFPISYEDSIRHALSDKNGILHIKSSTKTVIHISYVGFKTLVDTLIPNRSYELGMEPDVFNLDAFVVTASCKPQMADKSIYNIQVISKKDINYKGANNLTELLNNQLNMKINIDPSLGAGISLQGLSGEHVKFLIDGVPIVGRKNGSIDLSQINLNQVDHIEIIEGPMSVIYGSNALAGVINVITKPSTRKKFSAYGSSYYESVGVYNVDGGLNWTKRKHNFKASLLRNFFDGFTQTPELRKVSWKPKRQINGDLGYAFLGLKHRVRLNFSIFDEILQDKGNLLAPYYETAFDQYFNTTRTASMLDYTWQMKSFYTLKLLNSFSTYNWHKNTYFKDLTTLEQIISGNPDMHDTTGVYAILSRFILSNDNHERKLNFQVGYDINMEEVIGKRIDGKSKNIADYAAFISLNYKGIKNVKLQPGIRYSYNTKYDAPLVYSLNAQYSKDDLTVRLSAAKGFRAPSIKELYLDFQDINHNIFGNPDLLAENSININGSANWVLKKGEHSWSINASGFHNTINNIITLAIFSGGAYSYTNLNQYITKGVNLGLKYSFYPRINLDVNAGYLGILNDNGDELMMSKFLYSPSLTSNMEYVFTKAGIRWNIYYKFTGKLPQVAINEEGDLFETYVNSFHTMESSFSKAFFKNRLVVVVGGKNLFNNTTIPSTGASGGSVHSGGGDIPIGWGRSIFLKLTYNFNKY
jgi:outer membrane receptor for ferrienterochelin and colicins